MKVLLKYLLDIIERETEHRLSTRDLIAAKLKTKAKHEIKNRGLNFQQLILTLEKFWSEQVCVLQQPYDVEVGAGTMHPETFLRVLGSEPYRVAYIQPVVGPPTDVTVRIRIAYTNIRSFKSC